MSGDNELPWGLVSGIWGDSIASLGMYAKKIGVGNAVYFGSTDGVADFIKAQPFIHDFIAVPPRNTAHYYQTVKLLWNDCTFERGIQLLRSSTAEKLPDVIVNATIDFGASGPLTLANDLVSPPQCVEWANMIASELRKPIVLIQPFSINTNSRDDHWGFWPELMRWVIADKTKTVVLCGRGWDDTSYIGASNVISLVDKTPSVAHVFAMCDHADLVITTSNSVSLYAASRRLKTVVMAASGTSDPNDYFYRAINAETVQMFTKITSFHKAVYHLVEYDIWPRRSSHI